MRLDRIYSEGEAITALRKLGFEIREAPQRPGLYEASHAALGGARAFTDEQLCRFAEGVSCAESLLKREVAESRQG
jgi:hypothetical protein